LKSDKEERRSANAEVARSTRYPALNALLHDFVSSSREVLGENFCGAYLQGSFALGQADEYSDVDFLIVTHREVGQRQLPALQAMHRRLYRSETEWARHLEGSYFPEGRLRSVDPASTPLLYLDNGASELTWDSHCNRAVTRWTVREHGIALDGPDPKTLIDPVSPEDLRREALERIHEYVVWAHESTEMSRWKQSYLVLTFARVLNTVETGKVATKRDAAEWAMKRLAPEWASLIRQALDDRPDPWKRVHQVADAELTKQTLDFADYALASAQIGETHRHGLRVR
jgi:hypothetical protein